MSNAKSPMDNQSLNALGCHMLFGEVDQVSSHVACEFIIKSNILKAEAGTLFINTEGGATSDGFAIIDCMETSAIPIHTVALGMCMSMGVLIVSAGHKGTRMMTKNTEVMAHQFAGYFEGKQHELIAVQASFKMLEERFLTHFMKHCKFKTEKQVRDILFAPSDRYLTPAECRKYGIIDKVVDDIGELK